MAEREEPQDGGAEGVEPPEGEAGPGVPAVPGAAAAPGAPAVPSAPLDEEAAWAQIVASWGQDPVAGTGSWPEAENLPADADDEQDDPPVNGGIPVIPRAFVVRAPILGPRDYQAPDEGEDEGHFVPPEPPPLPDADVTTKFAWLAVLGGPALMLLYVLAQESPPWWAVLVGVGGFLGGFATLVGRMKDSGEDDEDPHGGAVV